MKSFIEFLNEAKSGVKIGALTPYKYRAPSVLHGHGCLMSGNATKLGIENRYVFGFKRVFKQVKGEGEKESIMISYEDSQWDTHGYAFLAIERLKSNSGGDPDIDLSKVKLDKLYSYNTVEAKNVQQALKNCGISDDATLRKLIEYVEENLP
jgi:hypothetical protein